MGESVSVGIDGAFFKRCYKTRICLFDLTEGKSSKFSRVKLTASSLPQWPELLRGGRSRLGSAFKKWTSKLVERLNKGSCAGQKSSVKVEMQEFRSENPLTVVSGGSERQSRS